MRLLTIYALCGTLTKTDIDILGDTMKLTIHYFIDALRRFKRYFLAFLALTLLSAVMAAVIPYATRLFIQYNAQHYTLWLFVAATVGFLLLYLVQNAFTVLWHRCLDSFGGKYIANLSTRMMNAVSRATMRDIDAVGSSNIKHILYYDNLEIFRVVGYYFPTLISCFVTMLAALCLAAFFSVDMMLFILVACALGFAISFFSRKIIAAAGKKENVALKNISNSVDSFASAIELVATNNLTAHFIDDTTHNIGEFIKTAKSADSKIYFFNGLVTGYYGVFNICLSCLLALPFAGGSLSNLVFFTMLAAIIINNSVKAETILFQALKAKVNIANAERLLTLPERQGEKPLADIDNITFDNVSFGYNDDAVLKNFYIHMIKGKIYAIEGANGSGKTTAVKLILGLDRPDSGSVLLNGVPVSEFSIGTLNEKILYCSQNEVFPNVTVDRYVELIAGRIVNADEYGQLLDFVNLRDLQPIENGGANLSGGQRKKLLLLKFLLRYQTSSVLILDEVFAGLDKATVERFQKFLQNQHHFSNKIMIIIEHTAITASLNAEKVTI
jgi:ABC-type bacteriocin/lantibiotic exporter with double-glycine peptidase domain